MASKIKATHEKASNDPNHTTFLKHFGEFTVAKIDKKEVPGQEYMLEELKNMRQLMQRLEHRQMIQGKSSSRVSETFIRYDRDIDICLGGTSKVSANRALDIAKNYPGLLDAEIIYRTPDHAHLVASVAPGADINRVELEELIGGRIRPRSPLSKQSQKS